MHKNKKIFIIAFFVFVLGAILIAIDMGSRTTAPWNKPKGKDAFKKYDIDHFKKKVK